jgi:pimeloyl-ACP methyl ester carboxylesterase
MKRIYLISGLGADKRAFQFLSLSAYKLIHVEWIKPSQHESLSAYAKRLSVQIPNENPIIIGLLLGGIIAMEIIKHISIEKVILISSVKTKNEIPFYYRILAILPIHKIIPAAWLKKSSFIVDCFFGVQTKDEKKLLKTILKDTDSKFLKWSLNEIINWKNIIVPDNIFHIHGTNDKILPFRFVKPNYTIKDGGHFMVVNKAEEISAIIKSIVN